MSSPVVLTASVTKLWANELPPFPNTALLQSSPVTAGSSRAFPSSSKGPLGRFPVPPGGVVGPKMSSGIRAFTVTEAVATAARLGLLAVSRSPMLMLVVEKVDEATPQVSKSGSGSWSVTTTLVAGPAPSFVTEMVNDAVSPGWIRLLKPLVTTFSIFRWGSRVTLADPWAGMMFANAPRFWASVNLTVAVLTSGVGSPAWMARVSVKVNEPPGPKLPPPAAMASASRSPNRLSMKELLALLADRTRFGLSAELVLFTVYV